MATRTNRQTNPDWQPLDRVAPGGTTGSAGRAGIALAVIATSQLMLVLDGTIVNIALPDIQRGLGFSTTGLAWVVNAYALAFGGLLLLGGRTGDILGRRRVFAAGMLLFTLASLLGGFAPAAGWLLSARAVQGIGAAIAAPSALALIASTFPDGRDRNKALGIYSAVQAAGASVGLIAGGVLTEWASWRWVLFVNVPIGAAILLLLPRVVGETVPRPGRFDLAGALTSTGGMTALVYGFIRAASDGWGDALALTAFTVATALLVGFLLVELRAEQPIVPLRLLGTRTQAGAYLNMLLLPAALIGTFFFLVQFVQDALGFSPIEAGLAFLPMTVAIFASSQLVPRWLPRVGTRPFLVTGAALIAGGMSWLSQVSAESDYASDLMGPMLLLGVGAGLSLVSLSLIILTGVSAKDSGAASGLLQTMQQVGGALGIAILVTRLGESARDLAETPAGTDSAAGATSILAEAMGDVFGLAAAFAALALLVAVGVFGAGRARRPMRSPGTQPAPTTPSALRRVDGGTDDTPEAAA